MQNSYTFQGVRIGKPTFKNRAGETQATEHYYLSVPHKLRKPGMPARVPTKKATKEAEEEFARRWLASQKFRSVAEHEMTPLLEHLGKEDPETKEWDGFAGVIADPGWRLSKIRCRRRRRVSRYRQGGRRSRFG
jgi:hypothetical protein